MSAPGSRLAVNFGVGFEQRDSRRGRIARVMMAAGGEQYRFRLPQPDAPNFLEQTGWTLDVSLNGHQLRDRYLAATALADAQVTDAAFAVEAHKADV